MIGVRDGDKGGDGWGRDGAEVGGVIGVRDGGKGGGVGEGCGAEAESLGRNLVKVSYGHWTGAGWPQGRVDLGEAWGWAGTSGPISCPLTPSTHRSSPVILSSIRCRRQPKGA